MFITVYEEPVYVCRSVHVYVSTGIYVFEYGFASTGICVCGVM